tara:strand:+ start:342 stop:755 length:414 start_codon:yes stop_codon:yes gene_type:complete
MLLKYYSTASEEEIYSKVARDLRLAEKLSATLSEDLGAYGKYLTSSFVNKEEANKIAKGLMDNITDIYSCLEVVVETTEFLSGEQRPTEPVKLPEGEFKSPEILLDQLSQLNKVRDKLQENLEEFKKSENDSLDNSK